MSTNEKMANEIIEELEAENARLWKLNAEMLDALETLLSECERVDYKPTQPLRFLSYDPDVIRKAFNAIRKAEGNEEATK